MPLSVNPGLSGKEYARWHGKWIFRFTLQVPEGYLPLRKYAEAKGLTPGWSWQSEKRRASCPKNPHRLYIHCNEVNAAIAAAKSWKNPCRRAAGSFVTNARLSQEKSGLALFLPQDEYALSPTLDYMQPATNVFSCFFIRGFVR